MHPRTSASIIITKWDDIIHLVQQQMPYVDMYCMMFTICTLNYAIGKAQRQMSSPVQSSCISEATLLSSTSLTCLV